VVHKESYPFLQAEVAHMTEPTNGRRGKVPLREFLGDFRSSMSDQDLKAKYNLTAHAFVSLVKALLAKQIISPDDLATRKEMAVQRDLARESQFLAGLFICPNCSHPDPVPFKRCPACGADVDEIPSPDDVLSSVTPSGNHIYVDSVQETRIPETQAEPDMVEAVEVVEEMQQDGPSSSPHETVVTEDMQDETTERPTALESVRSFLSKKFKKP
jgi:hypothetical protein